MSQTLTVIVGSPVGTPGTGSVTISGSPHQKTINPCAPDSVCHFTIPEYGDVSVAVGSETFSVLYGGTVNSSTAIASALASQINQQTLSPLVATVSGSTITITSTIKGAATNYPLSTSYDYDTEYFTYPAFTGSASGPTLTGGTD
jgi:phage tail sheath gpL-like